jgi:hypothetical protein
MSRTARNGHGGLGHYGGDQASYFSYFTETSSVTNPPELLGVEDDGDADDDISYITEASALTGWLTENSAALAPRQQRSAMLGAITEITESVSEGGDAFSKSAYSSFGDGDEVSTYDDGESVETSLAASNYVPNKAVAKAGQLLSPRSNVTSPRNNRQRHRQTFGSGDESSIVSNASKKRAPVPQLRNPEMDDTEDQLWEEECNCDINPTPLYQVIASQDWKQTIDLLDGKEEDSVWSLPGLTGIQQLVGGLNKTDNTKVKQYQSKLLTQARTWIVRRERGSGVLKWRMLPIHFALTYQAPFEVVSRLYHLYPGSVRCRDHRGMLPLHICFFRGGEDRVLELFLDVFPDALNVKDDKGRLAIECTPQDGSDNERRSNIMILFLQYMMEQQELLRLQEKVKIMHKPIALTQETPTEAPAEETATLGAVPRYTANDADDGEAAAEEKLNMLMLNAFKLRKPKAPKQQPHNLNIQTKAEPEEDKDFSDKYALADEENNPKINGNRLGLSPIPEDVLDENVEVPDIEVLRSELMALGKKKNKGIRKIFGKKKMSYN